MKRFAIILSIILSLLTLRTAYAQLPEITNGLNYLTSAQNPDGSWGGSTSRKDILPATVSVIETFQALNMADKTGYANALSWLQNQPLETTEYLAERMRVLAAPGTDKDKLLSYFNRVSNAWGGYSDYGVSIIDTTLSLQALRSINFTDINTVKYVLGYLISVQNADGGWGFYPGDTSNTYMTAVVLKAFAQFKSLYDLQQQIDKAVARLLTKQNSDGGFGSSPSTVHETALAFEALVASGANVTSVTPRVMGYLMASQQANGSWNNDPYSTSLALRVLAQGKTNLAVLPADITYAPQPATLGDAITISASIRNTSVSDASSVPVRFFDGDPASGGAVIGDKILPVVPAGGNAIAALAWTATPAAAHNIFVIVDQDNRIEEGSKSDNAAIAQIRVYEKIDLAIAGITFIPDRPAPGQSVDAQVKVTNLGGIPARNVVVRLSADGVIVGDKTIAVINSQETQVVTFTLQNLALGVHQISVIADPDNLITEGDRANNSLSQPVEIKKRIDLMVNSSSINFSNNNPKEGETIHIAAIIYNARENSADNVLVRIYDDDPGSGGTQVGPDQVIASIPAMGSAATGWIPYSTLGKSGGHAIYVVVDPLNTIDETNELNNTAVGSLTVNGRPDLVVQSIQFTPANPEEGDSVQITAVVKNTGSAANTVGPKFKFFLGDPSTGGEQIGSDSSLAIINPGASSNALISFNTTEHIGDNQIYAVIDPTNLVDEIDETNNTMNKVLTVRASTRPDFAVSDSDISFTPAQPVTGGSVTVAAQVHNLRDTSASNVAVNFYDGDPAAGGVVIGNTAISTLAGMGSEQAAISWNLTGITGKHKIFVKVDPTNTITETNETNNTASSVVKVKLPQGAAPVYLTATTATDTTINLAWQPGPEADAYGVAGYNIYRNNVLANTLRNIATQGTAAASSNYATYTASMANDGNINTYWYANYNAPAPQWWSLSFPTMRTIKKIVVYWQNSYYGKNYEVQTWDGAQWVTQATVTGNNKEISAHDFTSALTTDRIRINVTAGNYAAYVAIIREVYVYEENKISTTSYLDSGLGAGTYSYFAAAVDHDGVESLPSNTASASLGDNTPPLPPTGMATTVSGSTVSASWNKNSETDLAGYRVYRDGLNVALRDRGAWIIGSNGSSHLSVIDGNIASSGYTSWDANTQGSMTVILSKEFTITKLRMLLYDGGDNRFYRYKIESSTDGQIWAMVSDKTEGMWRGWQEVTFDQPIQARYFRITGTFSSTDCYFYVNEFEAYTSELAPKTLDTYAGFGLSVANYQNLYEYSYDLNTGTKQARKFIFSSFNLEEKDMLAIYDKDTNLLLANYTGNLGFFITPPLTASTYRFQFKADYEGTAPGYTIAGYITPGNQTALTYSEALYKNSSYQYAVTAIDKSGNESSLSNVVTAIIADSTAPIVPRNLAAVAGNGLVNLTWTADTEADLAGYNLYRNSDNAPINGSTLITASTYKDMQVINLSAYTYRITAVDVNGNESAKSAPVSSVPTGIDLVVSASDISFRPRFPSVFDDISVFAMVHNVGTDALPNPVQATLYVGNPSSGGKAVGTATIVSLLPGEATMVTFTWIPAGYVGTNTLYVVVDSDNTLSEMLETNNSASFSVTVNPEPMLNLNVTSVDSRSFPEISAFVRVGDWAGDGIFSLTKDNFTVKEDTVGESPIAVTLLNSEGHKPLVDIVFMFDDTGSMGGAIEGLKKKVIDFVHKLTASNLDYFLGLVTFKDDVNVRNNGYLTGNDNTFISLVNTLAANGGGDGPENSFDALEAGTTMHFRPDTQKVFIVITDAAPHVLGDGTNYSNNTVASIKQKLLDAGALTFVVGPTTYSGYGTLEGTYYGDGSITQATNGKFYNITEDFSSIVDDLANSIASMLGDYKITYTTHNPARDGALRNVAVEALYRYVKGAGAGQYRAPSDTLPDLTARSFTLSDQNPMNGQLVTISAEIENLGGIGVQNILVRFFDGNPAKGIQLGTDQVIASLPAAGIANLTANWIATAGTHAITMVIDPLNSIPESNENNNTFVRSVIVPGVGLAELGLTRKDIVFSSVLPSKGDIVNVRATIHNTGIDASDVLVLTYFGDPKNGGVQIGSNTISALSANDTAQIQVSWPVNVSAGNYDIFVWIDPYNTIPEGNKTDNIASLGITVAEKKLSVSIATDKFAYPAAADVNITATVQNSAANLWTGSGTVYIDDQSGNRVASLATFTVTDLKPSGLSDWAYRIPAPITAGWSMKDVLAGTTIDFVPVMSALNISGKTIDKNSLRVLEFDVLGNLIGEKQAKTIFHSDTNADVTWLMNGTTATGATRYFSIYLDSTDHGSKTPSANTKIPQTGKLIAYSDDTGNVYVAESNGDGTFAAARLVEDLTSAYDYAEGIVLDDFNNDGFVDIITGVGSTGDIYYFQNRADGTNTFLPKVKIGSVTASSYITGMAVADFNKDGNKDFVVSSNMNNQLCLFTGKGDGTFTQKTLAAPSGNNSFRGKAAADVDGDGNMDLVVATSGTPIYLYRGNSDGTFKTPVQISTAGSNTYGVVSGDFDGDGRADIIFNKSNLGDAYFLKGNGDGTFGTPTLIPILDTNSYTAFAAGDFNNDGLLDVIAATYTNKTIEFYPGKGDGTFGPKTTITTLSSTYPLGIASSTALAEVHPSLGSPEPVPSQVFNFVWNTGNNYAGNYKAHVTLTEGVGVIAESRAAFDILPDMRANAVVVSDKKSYSPHEAVTLTNTVTSLGKNAVFEKLSATVAIKDNMGTSLYIETKPVTTLMPGAEFSFKTYWNTGTYAAGTYPVTLEVRDATNAVIATGNQNLVISNIVRPSYQLRGQISLDRQSIMTGETVNASYSVTNIGNMNLSDVGISVLTINSKDLAVYNTISSQANLNMGDNYQQNNPITATNFSAKDYLVVLRAKIGDIEETLAGTYLRVEGAPTAPSLLSPANGSNIDTFTPALSVNNASDPNDDKLTYELELYSDSGLTQLVASSGLMNETTGSTTWQVPVTLVENSLYYWRCRAYDGKLYGPWMETAAFRVNTVNDPPTAPIISSPVDNGVVSSLTPVLTVLNATDPDSPSLTYNFELALDSGFTQIVSSTTGIAEGSGTTSWQVPVSLTENTTYYWRSQADDWIIEGPWSTTGRFFVNTVNEPPSPPVIIAPKNGATVKALEVDITVQNSTDPDSPSITYSFELDTVMSFDSTTIIRSGNIQQGQDSTTWRVTGLTEDTQYYARAKASDGQAESAWSGIVGFFTNSTNSAPTAPTLANPSNGAGVTVFTPTLYVHNSTDPDKDVLTYEFQLYADATLTTLVTGATGVIESSQITYWTVPVTLTENKTYYWIARASDGNLQSPWMATASFMINTADDAPGAPVLLSPTDGSTIATLTPTFVIANAKDPENDKLTYEYEVYQGSVLITSIKNVPENSTGMTSATLTTNLTDNTAYQWRARAFDGDRYGPWTAMASFTVHICQTRIKVDIDFDPETLNKKDCGKWVLVKIELPHGYRAKDVDISSIRLEGTVHAELQPYECHCNHHDHGCDRDRHEHNHEVLMVKFKRSEVIAVLPEGKRVPVHVTGMIKSTPFEGVDIIRVTSSGHCCQGH